MSMQYTPKDIGTASLIMQGAGALQSAVGAYYAAKSQKRTLRFQSRMAEINAKYAELAAQAVQRRGERQYQASRLATAQLKGKQRVAFAANGIDMSSDTAVRILTDTDLMGDIDALTIEQNTVDEVWNARRQATDYRNQSLLANASADSISPFGNAATSLMGSAGSVAQSWYQFSKQG